MSPPACSASASILQRTSVEPGEPVGIDIEKDEIVFFPLLYWPVLARCARALAAALAKLNTYMKNGGTIFFDTREDGADLGALTGAKPERRRCVAPGRSRSSTSRRSSRCRPITC